MKNMNELISEVGDVRTNPANVQRLQLSVLESALNGTYDIVDPSNPFTFLIELNAAVGTAGIMRNEALDRRRYILQAQTPEELYSHMSDVDFEGRFGRPGSASFIFLMDYDEIVSGALSDVNGIRKMTIPRDTEIEVEGLTFTLQYPIEFRIMPHGGLRIVYQTEHTSPLQVLESNVIEYEIIKTPPMLGDREDAKSIMFSIDVLQLKVDDFYDQLNDSSGFFKSYQFSNQFHYARVFISSGQDGEWEEIHTTHSDQVYDPLTPTALLKVTDQTLSVKIPQVYFRRDLLSKGIRIDVYTTQGDVVVPLDRYEPRNYTANYIDRAKAVDRFIEPIRSFGTITIYSIDTVDGGRNALTFEELRDKVMSGQISNSDLPITPAQLRVELNNMGYSIVKDIDNITNRIYMASRPLPAVRDGNVSSPVALTMQTIHTSLRELSTVNSVIDNGERITLREGTVFELIDGRVELVKDSELDAIFSLEPELRVQRVIDRDFVFIPVHYVLDSLNDQFEVRAYEFNQPKIYSKRFIDENETTQLDVSTHRYGISKHDYGYRIVLTTLSGNQFKDLDDEQVFVQLSFMAPGEIDPTYMLGTYLGRTDDDERMYEFILTSNFDVNDNNHILLNSFNMYDNNIERAYPNLLRNRFNITYIVSGYSINGIENSELDREKANFLLPDSTYAITREELDVELGVSLENLWRRSRTVASSVEYETYTSDVMAYYDNDVYEYDENGLIKMMVNDGAISYAVKHRKGDPVLDGDGVHVVKHRKGDPKLDMDLNPIVKSPRTIQRQLDLLLFEGNYKFTTDNADSSYLDQTKSRLLTWITEDLNKLNHRLLENTDMWFYPRKTLGNVRVIADDSIQTSIFNQQSFRVRFYLTNQGYNNVGLRQDLSRTAINSINTILERRTISVAAIADLINSNTGDEVVDVTVSGLGGSDGYEVVSILDETSNVTLKKTLTVLPNNNISLQDDVTIEYVLHSNER